MNKRSYVVGIDIGTESVRAVIYDEHGCSHGSGVSENRTFFRRPGWAEQSPLQWERSLVEAIQRALSTTAISPHEIIALGVDATCPTLVALDAAHKPLIDAIMWMDIRASQEALDISKVSHRALDVIGGSEISPEWFPCKVLWLKRHRPEVYARAHVILDQVDWLTYMLTGIDTLSLNTVSARWLYNTREGGFPVDLYREIGIGNFLNKIPDRVVAPGEVVGPLSQEFADLVGLPSGIPVAGGGADAYIGVFGLNALQPGTMALVTGSSHLQIAQVDHQMHAKGMHGSFPDALIAGKQVVEAGQISTGSVLRWCTENLLGARYMQHGDPKDSLYEIMEQEAKKIAPGSQGLIVLEHWQGNRTPWTDPSSRGVIRGLSLSHTTAHVYRAVLEGIAYGTGVILQNMREHHVVIDKIVACGGAVHSDLWMQIHADVTGIPIDIASELQSVSLGSAVLGFYASGFYDSISEASSQMSHICKTIIPDEERYQLYQKYIEHYRNTYELLKEDSRSLVQMIEA